MIRERLNRCLYEAVREQVDRDVISHIIWMVTITQEISLTVVQISIFHEADKVDSQKRKEPLIISHDVFKWGEKTCRGGRLRSPAKSEYACPRSELIPSLVDSVRLLDECKIRQHDTGGKTRLVAAD